jgi:hypothetical protein
MTRFFRADAQDSRIRDLLAAPGRGGPDTVARPAAGKGMFGSRLYRMREATQAAEAVQPPVAGPGMLRTISFPDNSCANVPITRDPSAQMRMIAAMTASTRPGLPAGVEETAFWGADRARGGYWLGPSFTDHKTTEVDVESRRPGAMQSWLGDYRRPAYFFHTHPYGFEPSEIDGTDRDIAKKMRVIGIAMDQGGRVTCS